MKLIPHFLLAILAGTVSAAVTAGPAGPADLSLSLSQAQALALERNHDLKLARSALASAEADVQSAAALPNPVVGVSTTGIGQGSGAGSLWRKQIDTVFGVTQLIERGNKRELRTENAQHHARAAGADLQDVQRQLRVLVAQAYADLMAARDKLAASRDASHLLDTTLAAAQTRRAAGDIAGADVERVKVDALRARNDVSAAQGELARARQLLAMLLGETARADMIEAADSWPALEDAQAPDAAMLEKMIDARADVRAARARLEAALSGTRLADALRTRDVTVGAQYEHYPQAGGANGSGGNSVGFSVSVPLFTRYYYQGEIASAQAALDAAQVALERTRERAHAEVGVALAALGSAAERVRRNRDELLVAAEKAARAAEYAYQNGAVGVMDVLDARRTLRATRLDALAAQADFSKALAGWKAAIEIADTDSRLAARADQ